MAAEMTCDGWRRGGEVRTEQFGDFMLLSGATQHHRTCSDLGIDLDANVLNWKAQQLKSKGRGGASHFRSTLQSAQ